MVFGKYKIALLHFYNISVHITRYIYNRISILGNYEAECPELDDIKYICKQQKINFWHKQFNKSMHTNAK